VGWQIGPLALPFQLATSLTQLNPQLANSLNGQHLKLPWGEIHCVPTVAVSLMLKSKDVRV